MYSITIMRDQRANPQHGESGSSWTIEDFLDARPWAPVHLPAAAIDDRCIRRGDARQTLKCGQRHLPRVSTALDPAKCISLQIAAGDNSLTGLVARSTSHDMSVKRSPRVHSGCSGAEDPWLPLGTYEVASTSCLHENLSALEFEAPRLPGTGPAGFGTSGQSREACPAIRRDKCG